MTRSEILNKLREADETIFQIGINMDMPYLKELLTISREIARVRGIIIEADSLMYGDEKI